MPRRRTGSFIRANCAMRRIVAAEKGFYDEQRVDKRVDYFPSRERTAKRRSWTQLSQAGTMEVRSGESWEKDRGWDALVPSFRKLHHCEFAYATPCAPRKRINFLPFFFESISSVSVSLKVMMRGWRREIKRCLVHECHIVFPLFFW